MQTNSNGGRRGLWFLGFCLLSARALFERKRLGESASESVRDAKNREREGDCEDKRARRIAHPVKNSHGVATKN